MRAASANLLTLLFLCTCSCVFYVWSRLERLGLLERHKREGLQFSAGGSFHHPEDPSSSSSSNTDLSSKSFRALLTVPADAQRVPAVGGRLVHNLTGAGDQTLSLGSSDYHMNVNNNQREKEGDSPGSVIEEGIFWSAWLEDQLLPVGFSEQHARAWRERARGRRIAKLEPGCGRVSNQLATFADGSRACVRYGINAEQVQGETLTYYLAALLGINNLPPLALAQVNADAEQWAAVRTRIRGLEWSERAVVSLTEWVSNLTAVFTPAPLRQEESDGGGGGARLHPPPPLRAEAVELSHRNKTTTVADLRELMQWSDLILLDYLTANFDRLVSNLFSRQWDAHVMERETNNLLRTPRGDLVFVDNEAGLVHGYRVLDMWEKYHSAVLGSVCVFRRRTARRVAGLHRGRDARTRLRALYRDSEPLAAELGFLSDEHAAVLQNRIDRIYKHMVECKGKYGSQR